MMLSLEKIFEPEMGLSAVAYNKRTNTVEVVDFESAI